MLAGDQRNIAREPIEDKKLVERMRQERHPARHGFRCVCAAIGDDLDGLSGRERRILRVDQMKRLERGAKFRVDGGRQRARREDQAVDSAD